jgi:HK97 family phage prohead protease
MSEYEARSSELWEEARFTILDDGDGFTMDGPMALYGSPSRMLSEAELGPSSRMQLGKFGKNARTFREVIDPGAFTRSLNAAPDIILHYQHDERSLPLGRTKAGTLKLSEEATQVRATASLPDNEWGRPVRDAVKRGDIGGISFRMGKVGDSWEREKFADGYDGPVRHLHEIQLRREVSLVTFPAYETFASVRQLAEEAEVDPDTLVAALSALKPDARLTGDQREALITVINKHSDVPVLGADEARKLTQMRERLVALAG